MAAVLTRCGGSWLVSLQREATKVPACGAMVDRWADQRIAQARERMQREHSLYRPEGATANAITSAITWIDDRIIDQAMVEERRILRAQIMNANRCRLQFNSGD